jgi:predicted NUDIX family NTP pyrophosphohydrolase
MRRLSAGLLMFKRAGSDVNVFLVHPGGPFWQKKDLGAWSIPKGEYTEGEDALAAARREFEEETGIIPKGEFISLDALKQPSGKEITVWAFEGDCSATQIKSNTFSMEWPPKSGHMQEFPEVDRADWFSLDAARSRILKGQAGFLDKLMSRIQYIPKPRSNASSQQPDSKVMPSQPMLFD